MNRVNLLALKLVVAGCIGICAPTSVAGTLQDIYALALSNDYQHKANKAALKAGKQAKVIARADLLPQISRH